MDETPRKKDSNTETDQPPMLVGQMESHNDRQHVIDITRNDDSSLSSSHNDQSREIYLHHYDDGLSSSTSVSTDQTTSSSTHRLNSRNSMVTRRTNDRSGPRRRSPLNSVIWISVELLVSMGQIIASIVVLSMSRNENPQAPLFAWVVGYASGCVATFPVLYWRFLKRNQSTHQDSADSRQGSSHNSAHESTTSYMAISVNPASDEEVYGSTVSATRNDQVARSLSSRLNGLMDHLKMALDIFFAVWFVVGNVWIFGGHSTPTDAPKLYRLCIVFLTISCIGYAMPFILCATICCCLPCIISLLGFPEDFSQARGATTEFINTLPIYKFKILDRENTDDRDNSEEAKGGALAAGKENERFIPGEDAVCCICLNRYIDNDALRELPCSHVFHVDCVDKWLKINASCPLCKTDVYESTEGSGQI